MDKINFQKVLTAGLAGTLAMSILMLIAPMMGMPKMDMGKMLGTMNPMMTMPYWMGWVFHFIIGIILTWLYASFLISKLPSDSWSRGAIFGIILFLIKEIAISPMMGVGIFDGGNMMIIMGALLGHIVFGAVMGVVYGDG